MGSTNKTTNYELSQFAGLDKPSWLSDYNSDMSKIDTAIKARSVEAGAAQTTADTANGKADALDTRMGTAENNITALQNASTTDHTQIATNTANISKNAQDIVQLDAKIGHTQITIGDHTVTGAIATLASQGGVEADNVSYDNTTSGLKADDVQEAIDELAARPTVADASDVTFDNTGTTLQATNVEAAIKEVASSPASNVRWNSTTDRFEVLKSGSWVQSIRAFVNSIAVWVAGVFGINVDNGVYTVATDGYAHIHAFSISGNNLNGTIAGSDTQAVTLVSKEAIDFSNYTALKATVDGQDLTIDVTNLNNSGYLAIAFAQPYGANPSFVFGVASQKDSFGTHWIDGHSINVPKSGATTITISEITVE